MMIKFLILLAGASCVACVHRLRGDQLYYVHPEGKQTDDAIAFCGLSHGLVPYDLTHEDVEFFKDLYLSAGDRTESRRMWLNTTFYPEQAHESWGVSGKEIENGLWLPGDTTPLCRNYCRTIFGSSWIVNEWFGLYKMPSTDKLHPFCFYDLSTDAKADFFIRESLPKLASEEKEDIRRLAEQTKSDRRPAVDLSQQLNQVEKKLTDLMHGLEAKIDSLDKFVREHMKQ